MPVSLSCPRCQTSYNLADSLRGKSVRCKKCEEIFPVLESPKRGMFEDADQAALADDRIASAPSSMGGGASSKSASSPKVENETEAKYRRRVPRDELCVA